MGEREGRSPVPLLAFLLVTDFVFDSTPTVLATGGVVVAFLVVWFAIPLRRRLAR